jgi:Fe-S-cluster-containing hydrogenase component 2
MANPKVLRVNHLLCSGCRACQVACVAQHEGRFGTALARLRVVKDESRGLDRPHVCRLCRPAPCLAACPEGALYRDEPTGAVCVRIDAADGAVCAGCGACVEACPFEMIALHPETGFALLCDLCGGDPACVKRCATSAIRYV